MHDRDARSRRTHPFALALIAVSTSRQKLYDSIQRLFLLLIISALPCVSWTVPADMDLPWPSRWKAAPGDRYMTKYGTLLSPNYLDSCLNQPVPNNVTRGRFPVQNGRTIFDLVNKTSGNPSGDSFSMDLYLAHLWYEYVTPTSYNTGVQNTYQKKYTMWIVALRWMAKLCEWQQMLCRSCFRSRTWAKFQS